MKTTVGGTGQAGQAESFEIMKNLTTGKVSRFLKNNRRRSCYLQNQANFASFHVFHDFSTDSVRPLPGVLGI